MFDVFKQLNKLYEGTIVEDIDTMRKYYPAIPELSFLGVLELDPTYSRGSKNAGTYGKWLLAIANKNKGVVPNQGHVTDVLRRFHSVKAHLKNKDIMRFKSVDEIDLYLNNEDSYTSLSARQQLRSTQKAVHNTRLDVDARLLLETENWQVWEPLTYEASCKLGRGTRWCTASTEDRYYYNYYTSQGTLFININKNTDEKVQIHFESALYMNKADEAINLSKFLKENSDLLKFYHSTVATKVLRLDKTTGFVDIEFTPSELSTAFDYVGGSHDIDGETAYSLLFDPCEVWEFDPFFDPQYLFDLDSKSIQLIKERFDITEAEAVTIVQDDPSHEFYSVLYDAYMLGYSHGSLSGQLGEIQTAARKELESCFWPDTDITYTDGGCVINVNVDRLVAEYIEFGEPENNVTTNTAKNTLSRIIEVEYHLFDEDSYYSAFDDAAANDLFRETIYQNS